MKIIFSFIVISALLFISACTSPNEVIDLTSQQEELYGESDLVVSIEQFKFNPDSIEINIGEKVVWVNKDNVAHTITLENGDNDIHVDPEGFAEITFNEMGEFRYFCKHHPSMQGTVIVK